MATEIKVNKFTTTYTTDKDGYTIKLFGDGAFIKEQEFGYSVPIADGQKNTIFSAENFGVYTADFNTKYVLAAPEPTPAPEPPPPPPPVKPPSPPVLKDTKLKQPRYMPSTRIAKPRSTRGGEFLVKETSEDYIGYYIKTYKKEYFAGKTIEEGGKELILVNETFPKDGVFATVPLILGLLKGFFTPKPTKGDKNRGNTKRYFVQDKNNNKIVETDKDTFQEAVKTLPNRKFATIDWIIKGPAQDSTFNGYPFEGAASKNKKAVQSLESYMPGISTFITNYSFLVEEPVNVKVNQIETQIIIEKDPEVKLENDRKANFDLRK
jgi:hypothetical protein